MSYRVVNPYNGELIKEFPAATDEEVEQALTDANNFYQQAKEQPIEQRAEQLSALADEFTKRADYYANFLTANMGKLISEALGEVKKTVAFARYYAENGAAALVDQDYTAMAGRKAHLEFSSIGAVVAVEPWNFPYTQVMRVFAPNFILGNPVILKHASIVPECAQAFDDACKAAGLPTGAFKNIFATYDQVNQMIGDPRVQGVALTGSEKAGELIAAEAGHNLKKSTMELGGTDVCIVLNDADLKKAVAGAVSGRLRNAGQACTSAKRYLVQSGIYDEFLTAIEKEFAKYQPGDPLNEKTTLAPLSSKGAQQNLQKQIKAVLDGGANVLWGDPTAVEGPGAFFKPLIISGMTYDNPMYDHELFGPVAQLYKVDDEKGIVELANHSNYGLGGAIYSENLDKARKLASKIETGQIAVNQPLSSLPELPFGGIKKSGYGRELSNLGIREFANIKTVLG
ncbi:NAD-dependent succinate-semialdehyde dehydrogenase [Liquorilactobacillus mali]|uniref:NAD-dependent aldehyde dehydrogenase n=1 Tax=Liquorilactobacillus mali KCTC 3596 = DSM 20444 TaxID=1046596 RepID=J0L7H2_9LACO|nr:NAD-dependent succinate-semialdehyde dehydrogenase [Liquorilactobacillus mali]EJF01186.1 NAD-dependent aldehyde dehydrogenase [Liquorilactobacillus mali KCTC 3596 = DSM 20444]KRN05044.1 NAD-dependent aldehyde dehydrogenase [Liquorilactobacillus mali KCTC 3596 = DSM 20444]MDC7954037.1 NAD-dependent succinate-semialdehyde dehydrogenase [Liquorilactobacillus mali]QFQ75447.1 NAD-dependent succinate-semialdehyde dehydrogenase [Liquorilactobacillus mali]